MKKKIIVACAGAVATSTIAAAKIRELCRQNKIEAEICQVRISEIESNLTGADLLVTTSRLSREYGVPYVPGMAFISGIGEKQTEEKIRKILESV